MLSISEAFPLLFGTFSLFHFIDTSSIHFCDTWNVYPFIDTWSTSVGWLFCGLMQFYQISHRSREYLSSLFLLVLLAKQIGSGNTEGTTSHCCWQISHSLKSTYNVTFQSLLKCCLKQRSNYMGKRVPCPRHTDHCPLTTGRWRLTELWKKMTSELASLPKLDLVIFRNNFLIKGAF